MTMKQRDVTGRKSLPLCVICNIWTILPTIVLPQLVGNPPCGDDGDLQVKGATAPKVFKGERRGRGSPLPARTAGDGTGRTGQS